MGIYDRDYLKESEPAMSATRRFSAVQILIAINVLVWIVWMIGGPKKNSNPELLAFMGRHFTVSYGGIFDDLFLHTLLTTGFSHQHLPHILFNMVALYYFGKMVEERFGFRNTIAAYVLCVLGGSILYISAFAQYGAAIGASSATVGLTLIAAILHPQRIFRLFGVLPMPLWMMASLTIVMDFSGVLSGGTGIAHLGHLGGMAVAFVLLRGDLWPFNFHSDREEFMPLQGLRKLFRRKPKLRIVERQPVPDAMPREAVAQASSRRDRAMNSGTDLEPAPEPRVDAHTAARVDALLAKISRDGMDALSPEERAFLKDSSPKYKRE